MLSDKTITKADAARVLGYADQARITQLVKAGELPVQSDGRISAAAIVQYIKEKLAGNVIHGEKCVERLVKTLQTQETLRGIERP